MPRPGREPTSELRKDSIAAAAGCGQERWVSGGEANTLTLFPPPLLSASASQSLNLHEASPYKAASQHSEPSRVETGPGEASVGYTAHWTGLTGNSHRTVSRETHPRKVLTNLCLDRNQGRQARGKRIGPEYIAAVKDLHGFHFAKSFRRGSFPLMWLVTVSSLPLRFVLTGFSHIPGRKQQRSLRSAQAQSFK